MRPQDSDDDEDGDDEDGGDGCVGCTAGLLHLNRPYHLFGIASDMCSTTTTDDGA